MKLIVSMRYMRGFGEEIPVGFGTAAFSTGVGRAGDSFNGWTGSRFGDFFLRAKEIV
jgi:hypothetical protein